MKIIGSNPIWVIACGREIDCSEELKMALKISMQIAYNQGSLQREEETRSSQQREDMYDDL